MVETPCCFKVSGPLIMQVELVMFMPDASTMAFISSSFNETGMVLRGADFETMNIEKMLLLPLS